MAGKAEVSVKLDTKDAKKKLQELKQAGESAAGGVNAGGSSFTSGVAQGFGLRTGYGLAKKVAGALGVFSSVGSVLGEMTSGVRGDVSDLIGAPDARARSRALSHVQQLYGFQAGLQATPDSPMMDQAAKVFNSALARQFGPEELGAQRLQSALGGGRGGGASQGMTPEEIQAVGQAISPVTDAISGAADRIIEAFRSF